MDRSDYDRLCHANYKHCLGCWSGKEDRVISCDLLTCPLHSFRCLFVPDYEKKNNRVPVKEDPMIEFEEPVKTKRGKKK